MAFEVQIRVGDDTWENVWAVTEKVNGKTRYKPEHFETREKGQAALDEHLEDLEKAGMDYSDDDFRIVEVSDE